MIERHGPTSHVVFCHTQDVWPRRLPATANVRFATESGTADGSVCPLCAISGLMHRSKFTNRMGFSERTVIRTYALSRAIPHVLVNEDPGSRRITASPVRNAFGGQVMGSMARLRRLTLGSGSPLNSIKYG
jgi:hypothetical protein